MGLQVLCFLASFPPWPMSVSVVRWCPAHPACLRCARLCFLGHVPTPFLEVGNLALAIMVVPSVLEMKVLWREASLEPVHWRFIM